MIEGRLVLLRPLVPNDNEALHRLEHAPNLVGRYRQRARTASPRQFADRLWADVLEQMVVLRRRTDGSGGQPIGVVAVYDPNLRNGTAWLAVAINEQHVSTGAGLEAVQLFLDRLFAVYPLRQVYAQIPGFNREPLLTALQHVEAAGILERHERLHGKWWDHYFYRISRESWGGISANLGGVLRAASHEPIVSADVALTSILARFPHLAQLDPDLFVTEALKDSLDVLEVLCEIEQLTGTDLEVLSSVCATRTLMGLVDFATSATETRTNPTPHDL